MNSRGGFIHAHYDPSPATDFDVERPQSEIKPSVGLAPLEVRDATNSELIRLSPASNNNCGLVSGSKGLLSRRSSKASANGAGLSFPARTDFRML
jgi:hypothetical protein